MFQQQKHHHPKSPASPNPNFSSPPPPPSALYIYIHMGGNPKIGVFPPKWMVYIMELPIKMDDLEGKNPRFLETSI